MGESGTAARGLRLATLGAAGLALVAVVLAAWYGLSWLMAGSAAANMRDEVLREVRTAIVNLETIDYRGLEDGLARREAWAAGPLLQRLQASRSRYADQVRQTQTVAVPTVLEAAVTELDTDAGAAAVLAFVDVTTTEHRDGTPTRQAQDRQRLKLQLVRTDDGWKATQADRIGADN